jgi:hypothetical protein
VSHRERSALRRADCIPGSAGDLSRIEAEGSFGDREVSVTVHLIAFLALIVVANVEAAPQTRRQLANALSPALSTSSRALMVWSADGTSQNQSR